jgi:hypothetical protein
MGEEQEKDFKLVYETMKSTLDLLVPLIHSKKTEEDFYKQFDGAKILLKSTSQNLKVFEKF